MSITNQNLIADSLGLIGVLPAGKVPSANQADQAIRKLNGLLPPWLADGIDLQYVEQTVAQLGENCPITAESVLAVTYFLGFALAPHYGKAISPELLSVGQGLYASLLREAVSSKIRNLDMTNLPRGTGHRLVSNILTG